MYGAEIWGSEEYKEVEGVKNYHWEKINENADVYTQLYDLHRAG